MKLHVFHFSPHGIVRAYSHVKAGRRLCRLTGMALRPLIPDSVNSMTPAYNVFRTLQDNELTPPETIIDVGANTSQMTKLLLGLNPNAQVISFEPNPNLFPIGEIMRIALLDSDSQANLFIPDDDTGWGTIDANKSNISDQTSCYSVVTRRMDSLIDSKAISWDSLKRPIMVKIDTEGNEKRIVDGFGKYLSDISYLLIEVDNSEQRGQNYNLLSLSILLSKHGFNQSKIVYACYDGPDAPTYADVLFWKK